MDISILYIFLMRNHSNFKIVNGGTSSQGSYYKNNKIQTWALAVVAQLQQKVASF